MLCTEYESGLCAIDGSRQARQAEQARAATDVAPAPQAVAPAKIQKEVFENKQDCLEKTFGNRLVCDGKQYPYTYTYNAALEGRERPKAPAPEKRDGAKAVKVRPNGKQAKPAAVGGDQVDVMRVNKEGRSERVLRQ